MISILGTWLAYGMGGLPGRVPRGIALACGVRLCVRLVQILRSSCESSVGRRYLRRGLRLSAPGHHLVACLLRCGNGLAGIVHFFLLGETHNCRWTARPRRASYYIFITLATVGYGDVTPSTPLARTLAWIEAITGQFYLAILVAGLVGIKVTQVINDQTPKGLTQMSERIGIVTGGGDCPD